MRKRISFLLAVGSVLTLAACGSDVMQYYDIPSRYEITDLSQSAAE